MKGCSFVLLPALLAVSLSSCQKSSSNAGLIGKWQRADEPGIVIEFTRAGFYHIYFDGQPVSDSLDNYYSPTRYTYNPTESQNNIRLIMGEGKDVMPGTLVFVDDDRMRIALAQSSDAALVSEYRKLR